MTRRPTVLLVGSGCREAALGRALAKSCELVTVARFRNPTLNDLSSDLLVVNHLEPEDVLPIAARVEPDFSVIGPEAPIAAGVTDALEENGYRVCGPSKAASRLEWDKVFMRSFLGEHLPDLTIRSASVRTDSEVESFLATHSWPVAVKPIGLSGGKGVKVEGVQLQDRAAVANYATSLLQQTAAPVLLEERVDGYEFTLHCITDGQHTAFFKATFDYSYSEPGDKGGQTGGMGSYCGPSVELPAFQPRDFDMACEALLRVVSTYSRVVSEYTGILQGQFFLTAQGLKVCEFAARFGDPEALNLFGTLSVDWTDVMRAYFSTDLRNGILPSTRDASVALCLAPPGYPESSGAGSPFEVDVDFVQEAGAEFVAGSCTSNGLAYRAEGGRAGALVANAPTIRECRDRLERATRGVRGLRFRPDVATADDLDKRAFELGRLRGTAATSERRRKS